VLDEQNLYTDDTPWVFDDDLSPDKDEEEDEDEGEDDLGEDDEPVDVTIVDSNDPVSGGEILDDTAELENDTGSDVTEDIEFVVSDDPEVVDRETVSIEAASTDQVALQFETFPVAQDDSFPARVETTDAIDEVVVEVEGED